MDRRLGEPLPHQLANPTRAHPMAINLSPVRAYTVLPQVSLSYSVPLGKIPTRYSPVCHSLLLGVRLACVRPAASVRSEPGSNSQVESCDSGRLGGSHSKDFCVTGTFTHDALCQGCPESSHHGDGMKRSIRQSSVSIQPSLATPRRSPQGLRRLRFPFFDQLVKEHQRRVSFNRLTSRLPRQQDPFRLNRWRPFVGRWSNARRGRRSTSSAPQRGGF